MIERPSWENYFLGLAFIISRKSPDIHTKHGCLLVAKDTKHIIGTGFNGFPSGMPDEEMPLNRPDINDDTIDHKYWWMDHDSVNVVANCVTSTVGSTLYATGYPCFNCAKTLCRHGIKKWVVAKRHGYTNPPAGELERTEKLIKDLDVEIKIVKPDLNWIFKEDFQDELRKLGFIN